MAKAATLKGPKSKPLADLPVIEVDDPIPAFASEREEAEFWASHGFGETFFEREWEGDPNLPPPRARTRPVSVRFDDDVINRLQAVAARKNKGYQTLLKEFVAERLYEEEKRLGIVGS